MENTCLYLNRHPEVRTWNYTGPGGVYVTPMTLKAEAGSLSSRPPGAAYGDPVLHKGRVVQSQSAQVSGFYLQQLRGRGEVIFLLQMAELYSLCDPYSWSCVVVFLLHCINPPFPFQWLR